MLYRQIILEWGQDTESGVWGLGYSPDNGKNFYVLNTTHGRKYRAEDGNRLYPYISDQVQDKIETVVAPAKSAADSAASAADAAVASAQVTSDAVSAIASATAEAKAGANDAMIRAKSAWDAAQSNVNLIDLNYASASASISSARTEAIAAADEAKASASAAQAGVVAVRSDVAVVQADVTATRSDVAVAKSAIADTKTSLTSQAKSLSSYAAQASANGADIVTLKSQAGQFEQEMADTKGDVSQLKVSASAASVALSDAAGNISSLQATAKSYSAALSDTNSNVASVTATASELETKYADAAGDINKLQTDAKGTTQTLNDAQGDIAKLKIRADGFDTEFADTKGNINKIQADASGTKQTLTNAKSDIAVLQSRADGLDAKYADAAGDINTLKTNASGFSQTLTNAQGDISTLKSTVSGVQTTLTDAQGNISTLQSDVSGLKKTTSDHTGSIATLQSTANTLTSQMSSAQGDISTLKQTASGISSQVSSLSNSAMQNRGTVNSPDFNSLTQSGYYTITSPANGKKYPTGSWGTLEVSGQVTDINGRLNQKYVSDNNGTAYTRQYNAHTNGWTTWVKVANQNDIDTLNGEITANTTAINQNKNAIALKADQTAVDKINGTVSQMQSTLTVQAGQIQEKVTSSQVTGMLSGYATQDYTQSLVTQKADEWNVNLTKLKNDTQTALTNLSIGVEGVQAQVYNSDGSSKITQLSNLIATKVSQGDFTSTTTQLKNLINQRVQVGDVISQINQEAGGDTLIQVSNGKKSLILDAETTVFTGNAFIPSAAIAELDADKLTFYGNGAKASIGASIAQYDDDKTKSTINLQYDGGIEIHSSSQQGSILTMHDNTIRLASKSWGDNSNPYQYSGFYAAPNYSLMNTYHKDGTTSGVAIDDKRIWIYGDSKDQKLGALQADVGWYSINGKTGLLTGNQISLKAGNTQTVLTDNNINIENTIDTNSKNYDVGIHIKGWAEMTGWFTCMGISQTSLLSTKTRIEPLDTKVALDKIVSANVNTYQFKTDVAKGKTKRHASVIIDDVHDVAEYCTPEEFISEDRKGRDDGDIIGYLMGAVQELAKRIKTLEDKLNE